MSINAYLNVKNIDKMLEQPPQAFSWIGFDSVDNCNLHCVYCHNPRTKQMIDLEKFERFIHHHVLTIENFQIGCQMEPSLDKRMVGLLQMIAESPAKPSRQFKVHTNGTLLNRHDARAMVEAGLTHLSISIDTVNEKTFSELRGGAKLERVFRNVKQFCETCPEVTVQFIATVTQANVDEMDLLVHKGVAIGAKRFHFREMFHDPRSPIVDHQKMEKLLLPPGRFQRLKSEIEKNYGDQVGLFFVDSPAIRQYGKEAHRNSR
ncbi:radical SAM protein [Flavilitoribacter nigricans]|uniref:Radical SAM core domain-containing protein n=1 Tax=Flavilitoribacter nigricans (strain ATCC 23147 / DSM 23189 / NBRC 102662 / NCIMB 1420 / SS-2) TaxID=1122177 RepID=A0A2D0MXU5_FLAN2|nr:radical SAM protein [Flavilitoribacter nigricans]PHN00719.1 hypothetical protein CRP01_40765 [Flavilitoribacter nigricans DSM 23189 = NBRC 102662]